MNLPPSRLLLVQMVLPSPGLLSVHLAMLFSFSTTGLALDGQEAAMFGEQVQDGYTGRAPFIRT